MLEGGADEIAKGNHAAGEWIFKFVSCSRLGRHSLKRLVKILLRNIKLDYGCLLGCVLRKRTE